jgi:hypothetical protein
MSNILITDCGDPTVPVKTMHGLYDWYVHKFEKLGWVLLHIYKSNNSTKLQNYLCGMRKLHKSLQLKVNDESYDIGKRKDVKIMIDNIEVLLPQLEIIYNNFNVQRVENLPLFGGKVKRIVKSKKKESKKNSKKGSKKSMKS